MRTTRKIAGHSRFSPSAGLCLVMGLALGTLAGASVTSAVAAAPEADGQGDHEAGEGEEAGEEPRVRPAIEPVGELPAEYSRFRKLDRFARALAIIEQYYVRPVDGEELIDAALAGLVSELDPHTIYLPPEDAKLLLSDTEGRFGGVGLVVTLRAEPLEPAPEADEARSESRAEAPDTSAPEPAAAPEPEHVGGAVRLVLHIDDVIPGGPAQQAGLKMGDRIVEIEGKAISNFSDLGDAVTMMRGEPGTRVSFTYLHEDQGPRQITVTRAIVDPPAVQVRWLGEGLGVLRLRDFQEASASELRKGIDELRATAKGEGGQLQGVVLDLRDNGGGLLDQAIEVADIFVAEGVIVRTRGRQAQLLDEARARVAGTIRDLPLVVLINKGSASASEIVAGALQDHRRALIIGERSYGKGSVQAPFQLGGGALLKLTTALYYTPEDRLIQASGIAPDIMVGPLLADYEDSRPDLRPERANPHHLRPEDFGRQPVPEEGEPPASPARAEAGEDAQLLAAVDHLQAWARVTTKKKRRRR